MCIRDRNRHGCPACFSILLPDWQRFLPLTHFYMRSLLLIAAPAALLTTPGLAQSQTAATLRTAKTAPVLVPTNAARASTNGKTTVLLTDLNTSPLSTVVGAPAGTLYSSFDRPSVSQDGKNWAIVADTNLSTSEDDVIVVNGTVAIRELSLIHI